MKSAGSTLVHNVCDTTGARAHKLSRARSKLSRDLHLDDLHMPRVPSLGLLSRAPFVRNSSGCRPRRRSTGGAGGAGGQGGAGGEAASQRVGGGGGLAALGGIQKLRDAKRCGDAHEAGASRGGRGSRAEAPLGTPTTAAATTAIPAKAAVASTGVDLRADLRVDLRTKMRFAAAGASVLI